MTKFFKKSKKTYFEAILGTFYQNFGKNEFSWKKWKSVFKYSYYLWWCKKWERTNNPFLRKLPNWRTDNNDFIGPSVGQGSKISNLEKFNSLWEGKIIVNHIVSSKLWFISQIYTILKYIKKKTEKRIHKFLSNYKKYASKAPTILGGVFGTE